MRLLRCMGELDGIRLAVAGEGLCASMPNAEAPSKDRNMVKKMMGEFQGDLEGTVRRIERSLPRRDSHLAQVL